MKTRVRKRHLSVRELFELLNDPAPQWVTRKRESELAHFVSCHKCRENFNAYARLHGVLADRYFWYHPPPPSPQQRRFLERLGTALRQISDEHVAAKLIVDKLTGVPAGWRAQLATHERLLGTCGMVDALIERAEATFASDSAGALTAAMLAVEAADSIPVNAYAFDFVIATRARAALEHAFMLGYRGDFPKALTALDRAESLFRQLPLMNHQLARTDFVRAFVYRSIDRIPEAITLTQNAIETFARYNDTSRVIGARTLLSAMLIQQGRPADALPVCEALQREPQIAGTQTLAMTLHNLGICHRELGNLDRADELFAQAIEEYGKHHATTEVVRTQWCRASTLSARGRTDEAILLLRQTWVAFSRMGMEIDAALVALELAETLLATGQAADVPALCRQLLDHFTRNNMYSRAVTALSFLREALAMNQATTELVRGVRNFIAKLQTNPNLTYVPPPR
jgi:tetratricopeptide (TPR) repeat protein